MGIEKRDLPERGSTDEGLRSERKKTDIELASRSEAVRDVATDLIAEARQKADAVLSTARELEDRKSGGDRTSQDLGPRRAREDAVLEWERRGADTIARDEREQRQLALASLLAFEREYTDLKLETERERADQALTSRDDFLAIVSHDLRSLLGGIALSAELLKGVGNTDDPLTGVMRYAEQIQRFSARMNRIVGDLIDVASIERGKLSLVRTRRNAAVLLRDAMEAFEPATSAQDIQLVCECAADPGTAELDHDRILQVLTNLVGNALKFTPKGGRIVIRLTRQGDDLCFAVQDTGRGIPHDMLDKIFDRYFQTLADDRRGLGLGLFIAKSIVEQHGGRIRAESTPGHGSTFTFLVPARAPTPAGAASSSSDDPS